jgi:hypothetical protein
MASRPTTGAPLPESCLVDLKWPVSRLPGKRPLTAGSPQTPARTFAAPRLLVRAGPGPARACDRALCGALRAGSPRAAEIPE